jgi:hypothetical protein
MGHLWCGAREADGQDVLPNGSGPGQKRRLIDSLAGRLSLHIADAFMEFIRRATRPLD